MVLVKFKKEPLKKNLDFTVTGLGFTNQVGGKPVEEGTNITFTAFSNKRWSLLQSYQRFCQRQAGDGGDDVHSLQCKSASEEFTPWSVCWHKVQLVLQQNSYI